VAGPRISDFLIRYFLACSTRKMLDPLSIAGLTIAIFDQLLKLGERTAQLIADAKTFDDVRFSYQLGRQS
jgi:hypothetical protein